MKLLVLFILSIIIKTANSQCPNYIGRPYQEGVALIKTAEKYFGVKIRPITDFEGDLKPADFNYKSDTGYYRIFIFTKADSTISSIYMEAPASKIDTFVKAYFVPLLSSCASKKSENWLFWNKQKIIFPQLNSVAAKEPNPKRSITIEEDEHPIKKATK